MSNLKTLIAGTSQRRLQIGRFEILETLGPGGSGLVFRAYDPIFRRRCALKVPHPHVLADPGRRERFLAQARALARLGEPVPHANVVRVYDADECGGICYVAMELCECSLADWLSQLPEGAVIPACWAAELVKQIAAGVQHAHERGIIHRDLKPANILLTPFEAAPTEDARGFEVSDVFPRFRPKVADFDLAKILGENGLTSDGSLIGTRPYMAPEQIRCDSASIDKPTDVWALGVILYELLTGRLPFPGPSEEAYRRQICEEEPTHPHKSRDLPRGLETVCLKCLEKVSSDRYRSPSELANELQRVLENLDPLGRLTPPWKRAVRGVKRHPVRAALLGMTTVAAMASAEYVGYRQRGETDLQIRRLSTATVDDLEDLVPGVPGKNRDVVERLEDLFVNGDDDQKLATALVLAETSSAYREYCYRRLLDARPEELGPIARLLNDRMPDLVPRLETCLEARAPAFERDPRGYDRCHLRRANAACALQLLNRGDRLWSLLRFDPDPQTRTILVHRLVPGGIEPREVLARLDDPRTEVSIRRALIQSLEPVAEGDDLRAEITKRLLDLYRNDFDAGVHGSAKWVLLRWGLGAELERINAELAGKTPPDPRFRWRISREGLTMITIDHPSLDRVIEVSDTEITVAMFRDRFRPTPSVDYDSVTSPQPSCPVNWMSYFDAAAFCNWLTSREGYLEVERCYRSAGWHEDAATGSRQAAFEPEDGYLDRQGYRLPTSSEFVAFCAAGTSTRRYHGASDLLFDRYAWTLQNSGGPTHPVAGLIPNEDGLFDTLGNIMEWCESAEPRRADGSVAGDQRGGFSKFYPAKELDIDVAVRVPGYYRDNTQGFRVVRTKEVR